MARRVFFSFHRKYDIHRVQQVQKANRFVGYEEAGFFDQSEREDLRHRGDAAILASIQKRLDCSTVTAVLIGTYTWQRGWVALEIRESIARYNALIGILIHTISGPPVPGFDDDALWRSPTDWRPSVQGLIPSDLPATTPIYTWGQDVDRQNFAQIIEQAGQRADKMREARLVGQKQAIRAIDLPSAQSQAEALTVIPPRSIYDDLPQVTPPPLPRMSDIYRNPPHPPPTRQRVETLDELIRRIATERALEELKKRR